MLEVVILIGFQGAGKSTTFEKKGFNPKVGQAVTAVRRRIKVDRELPLGDDYSRFIAAFLTD